MVVQHNLQAMNSNRMLNVTQGSLSKSTEKLSSGYRINRAADDAAGLAISEKMRKQINGLNQASSNAQDGISCVQTAEGALAEVEDMLQRMNQLSVQASNGTNSVDDRKNIQDEIDQLVTEIDRVAETSKFNETYLLKGATDGGTKATSQFTYKEYKFDSLELGTVKLYGATNSGSEITAADIDDYFELNDKGDVVLKEGKKVYATSATDPDDPLTTVPTGAVKVNYKDEDGNTGVTPPVTGVRLASNAEKKYFVTGEDGTKTYLTDANIEDYMDISNNHQSVAIKSGVTISYINDDGKVANETTAASIGQVKTGQPMLYDADGNRISENGLKDIMAKDGALDKLYTATGQSLKEIGVTEENLKDDYVKTSLVEYADDLELTFHVGSEGASSNKISIDIESMSSKNLGVDILSSSKNGIVDDDGQSATDAIGVIAEAIQKVSSQRSSLGAVQNRLEHTINNLDNIAENTTSAESAIRDTDMATEMVKYSNANILAQAGQSMLAQANQSNQGVLSLLG